MNLKLSGELPLTAFFPPANKHKHRRRENSRPGLKRKPAVLQPDNGTKRRKVLEDFPAWGSSSSTTDPKGKHARASVCLPTKNTPSSSLTPSTPLLFIHETIEISDDEQEESSITRARVSQVSKENTDIIDTPKISYGNVPGNSTRSAWPVLQNSPIRPNKKNTPPTFASRITPHNPPANRQPREGKFSSSSRSLTFKTHDARRSIGCRQRLDSSTLMKVSEILEQNSQVGSDLGDNIVPSSQTSISHRLYTSPSQEPARISSPILKPLDLPVDTSTESDSSGYPLSPPYVPSSQTQCMIRFGTSPCKIKNLKQSTRSALQMRSPLDCHETLPPDFVESSQSQLETEVNIYRSLSPSKLSAVNCLCAPSGLFDSSLITSNARDVNPSAPDSPNYYPQSQDSLMTYTSPIRVPSDIAAALDSDDEMSSLPAPLQKFRDMFDDETRLFSQHNPVDVFHSPKLRASLAEDSDSATESDSEDDEKQQSAVFRPILCRAPSRIRPSLSFELEPATSPIVVPTDPPDAMSLLDDGSLGSLPSPAKNFRAMFDESGSWPADRSCSLWQDLPVDIFETGSQHIL